MAWASKCMSVMAVLLVFDGDGTKDLGRTSLDGSSIIEPLGFRVDVPLQNRK